MNKPKCPTIEGFKKVLKKHDLKATPQRIAVHEAMISLGHASADMVTEAIEEGKDMFVYTGADGVEYEYPISYDAGKGNGTSLRNE